MRYGTTAAPARRPTVRGHGGHGDIHIREKIFLLLIREREDKIRKHGPIGPMTPTRFEFNRLRLGSSKRHGPTRPRKQFRSSLDLNWT